MDGRADQALIQWPEVHLPVEDQISGVLDPHDAPMIGRARARGSRAVAAHEGMEDVVEALDDGEVIGQRLRLGGGRDTPEDIVPMLTNDASPCRW